MKSEHPFVLLRAGEHEAREFLRIIEPALVRLSGVGGIICREEKYGDMLYDVRAQVEPPVAHAIFALVRHRQVGREEVNGEMIRAYLQEAGKGKRCR